MSVDDKDSRCNPQHVVVNTLRTLIINLHSIIKDLAQQQEQIKKIIESRSKRMTAYISENEQHIKEIKDNIEETRSRIKTVEKKMNEVDDFLKDTKMNLNIWKKCLLFMKDFPGQITMFFASLATIAFFIAKFFGV